MNRVNDAPPPTPAAKPMWRIDLEAEHATCAITVGDETLARFLQIALERTMPIACDRTDRGASLRLSQIEGVRESVEISPIEALVIAGPIVLQVVMMARVALAGGATLEEFRAHPLPGTEGRR